MSSRLIPAKDELIALARAGCWDVYDAAEIYARRLQTGVETTVWGTCTAGIVMGDRLFALVFADEIEPGDCDRCHGLGKCYGDDEDIGDEAAGQECEACGGSGEWYDEATCLWEGVILTMAGTRLVPDNPVLNLPYKFVTADDARERLVKYQQEKAEAAATVQQAVTA